MAKNYRIDKRVIVTGNKSQINLAESISLNKIVKDICSCCNDNNQPSDPLTISPSSNYILNLSSTQSLSIMGTGFTPSSTINIVGGFGTLTVLNITFVNSMQLIVEFSTDGIVSDYGISVTDGSETSNTVLVKVQDSDRIRAALSGTSLTNYNAASSGDWVAITEAEWNNLKTTVSNTLSFGTSDADLKTGIKGAWTQGQRWTYGQNTNPSLSGVYVYAFKFASSIQIGASNNDVVRLSSTGVDNWLQIGNTLPTGVVDNEVQHFVLKGSQIQTTAPSYVGFTTNANSDMYYDANNTDGLRGAGDTDNPIDSGFGWSMQMFTANSIQWTL